MIHNKVGAPRVVFLDVRPVVGEGGTFDDAIYSNIEPVILVLRTLGVLPLTKPKGGLVVVKAKSPAMLYSIVVFASFVAYVGYVSMHRVKIVRSAEGRFEEAVIAYLFTVYLFPVIVVPILWYESRKVADVLNGWTEFEMHYRAVSGRVLPLKLRNKAIFIATIIPILSTASVFITHITMVHFRFLQVLPYVFLEILTYVLGGYWYLLCEALSTSASLLADDFQQALRHIGPAGLVAEYRALWLRLSKLARDTGVANCYTFTFINLYLFLIITLSIYGLMSQISEGFGVKDIGLAVTACFSIGLLFVICNEAHYASHNVRTNFQKKLLMVELSWMNSAAQTEVNMFLRATEMNPSAISLGGFFDVNRNLFKSVVQNKSLKHAPCYSYPLLNLKIPTIRDFVREIPHKFHSELLATMVTYLVVLLQFQISIPEDANASRNSSLLYDDDMDGSDMN